MKKINTETIFFQPDEHVEKANKNSVNVCFCTSNKYAPYCGITIESIIDNSDSARFYDILIFEHDITDKNKEMITSLIVDYPNFSVRFINVKDALKDINVSTWAHFSVVACFKLFLFSEALKDYDKIVTLDTDLIFQRDVADLYDTEIDDNLMAAVDDVIMKRCVALNKFEGRGFAPAMTKSEYITDYLGYGSDEHYFNTGVVVLNLREFRKINAYEKAFFKLRSKGYVYQEQDVLNELSIGRIYPLDYNWNLIGTDQKKQVCDSLNEECLQMYLDAYDDPYIIHYAGGVKPWSHINIPFCENFFYYAKKTPWYETILLNIPVNYANYVQSSLVKAIYSKAPAKKSVKDRAKAVVDRILPKGTRRREFVKKFFPRGSSQRMFFHDLAASFSKDFRTQQKQHNRILRLNNAYFSSYYKKINDKYILLDSKNGTDLAGNIFRLIQTLSSDEYKKFTIYLTYQPHAKERICSILNRYGLSDNVNLVEWCSEKHYKLLARSKYLVSDLYMPDLFVKRQEQILISTAHGTPLKVMGKDCHTETQGFLQRMHMLSDYQTFPSEYMKEKLFGGFMEDNLFTGHAMKSGYCRNCVFFDKDRRVVVRKELGVDGKWVIAYLPTFRGIAGSFESENQIKDIKSYCDQLDTLLKDNEVLFIKLHNFNNARLDLSSYKHIKPFPMDYEVYDVLNATDVLVSDYSSVFFDYANSGRKIVLFQYDFDKYMAQRGVYLSWNELPFPVVDNAEDLYAEISTEKNYDDTEFLKEYCTYDQPQATENVCHTIFAGKPECADFESSRNGKKNILIHIGNFDLRSPTTYLVQEFFNRIDTSKANYYVFFYEYDLFSKAHRLQCLPPDVNNLSYLTLLKATKKEIKAYQKYMHENGRKSNSTIDRLFERECRKMFADLPIDLFIDLSGKIPQVNIAASFLKCKKAMLVSTPSAVTSYTGKYDYLLAYEGDDLANQLTGNVILLDKGYSKSAMDHNAKIIGGLCQE